MNPLVKVLWMSGNKKLVALRNCCKIDISKKIEKLRLHVGMHENLIG